MEIADPLIVTTIGTLAVTIGTMAGAVVVLFRRSEICLRDRDNQADRIDALERAIYGCPITECPNKPSWKKPATGHQPRLPGTTQYPAL